MFHFLNRKTIALLAVVTLATSAQAATQTASQTATLTLDNNASDVLTASSGTLTWNGGATATGSSTLSWKMYKQATFTRSILVKLNTALAAPFSALTVSATVTGVGTGSSDVSVSTTDATIITGLADFNEGSAALAYRVSVAGGFADTTTTLTFTILED